MQPIPQVAQSGFEIIATSFQNYACFFKQFFLISFLSAFVYGALSIMANILMQAHYNLLGLLIVILAAIISLIFTSAVYYFLFACLHLRQPTIKNSLDIGTMRFFSILLATFIASSLMIGGFVFLIIPGLIFWIYIVFYQPLIVVYDYKSSEALFYSYRLVKNHWWRTLGILLLSYLIVLLPIILYTIACYYYATHAPLLVNQLFISVLLFIYQIFMVPLMMLIVLHLLLDLEIRKNAEIALKQTTAETRSLNV